MPTSKIKSEQIVVRVEPELRKALEKEAREKGLDLTAYARSLWITHPERLKSVKKS